MGLQGFSRYPLDTVVSPHTRRNYGKALDGLFALAAGRPVSRALLMEYRATMDALSPSTVDVEVKEIRRQFATYKRFKRLVDERIDLSIEHSRLTMQIAGRGATR